jgi:hypothetical protein
MPVENLKYLPRSDCYKPEIGGLPLPSHAYDFNSFGLVISYNGVSVGVSPGEYRHLVAEKIDSHRDELDGQGIVDEDPYWDFQIKELMVNNLASFYIANSFVNALRRISKAALAEIRPAQTKADIFSNNHMVILRECQHAFIRTSFT